MNHFCSIQLQSFLITYLCVPKSTDGLVGPVAWSPLAFVVLKHGSEEEEEGDRGVDDALVGDVNVGELLVHRFVQRNHRHHVDVRYQPEQTCRYYNCYVIQSIPITGRQ